MEIQLLEQFRRYLSIPGAKNEAYMDDVIIFFLSGMAASIKTAADVKWRFQNHLHTEEA